jgi:hypothetical protein
MKYLYWGASPNSKENIVDQLLYYFGDVPVVLEYEQQMQSQTTTMMIQENLIKNNYDPKTQ